ncbi:MAG: dipeptidase [Faecalimonas sp.]|nr:dipeptidase [Faecalimonas sp.]
MSWIDLHCDTIYELERQGKKQSLQKNSLCIDLAGLQQAGVIAQCFAAFVNKQEFVGENAYAQGYQYALRLLRRAKYELAEHTGILALADGPGRLQKNMEDGKISVVLTVEEGGILEGKAERLEALHAEGVRMLTLTWNWENCIGYPNSREEKVMASGLKPFGFEVIARMNQMGMLIDVSHLSDGGFWDVIKYSKEPVLASHSNARALCAHPRNLTDEMIRMLAGKGGIAGVNFYPYFLNGTKRAGLEELVYHILYMYRLGGEEFVALGTDFDGFSDAVNEIGHVRELGLLYEALKKKGLRERQLDKFCYGNALRLLK